MNELEILASARALLGGADALPFWQAITCLGDSGILWIALGVFFLFFKPVRRTGCAMGVALFIGFLACNATLKPLAGRLRPCEVHPDDLLYACPTDPSFPSGHTTASFAAALALAAFHPRSGTAMVTLAVLIAWSRLYLFVHWPTDVAAGVLIGAVGAALSVVWLKRLRVPAP